MRNNTAPTRLLYVFKKSVTIIVMLLALLSSKPLHAQGTIQIDNANSLEYVETHADKIRKLIGDVQLRPKRYAHDLRQRLYVH